MRVVISYDLSNIKEKRDNEYAKLSNLFGETLKADKIGHTAYLLPSQSGSINDIGNRLIKLIENNIDLIDKDDSYCVVFYVEGSKDLVPFKLDIPPKNTK